MAWVEISCEIVCTLTCRELSKPETHGTDFLNGCRALSLDTELPISTAGVGCGARKGTREMLSCLSQALSCVSALSWTFSHLPLERGRLKLSGRDQSLLLKTGLLILQVNRKDKVAIFIVYKVYKEKLWNGENMENLIFLHISRWSMRLNHLWDLKRSIIPQHYSAVRYHTYSSSIAKNSRVQSYCGCASVLHNLPIKMQCFVFLFRCLPQEIFPLWYHRQHHVRWLKMCPDIPRYRQLQG